MARPRRVHLPRDERQGKEQFRLRGSWNVASMPTLIGGTVAGYLLPAAGGK